MHVLRCRTWRSISVVTALVAACREQPPIPPPTVMRAPAPWLWGRLERGGYAVGLHVTAGADSTRIERLANGTSGPRPLEIVLWIPGPRANLTRDTVRRSEERV